MPTGFTAPLQNPGRSRYGSGGGVSDSLAGPIGEGLSGIARIGDMVLGKMEERDARAAGNDVSNQLTDLVRENFGATPSGAAPDGPALVGEDPADPAVAAAKSSPVVQDAMGQLDRLSQANKQGALNPQELMTRGSVIVQDAINRNPLFAQEIRQAAQGVLGVQPTQDLVKMAEADTQRTKALEAEVTHGHVMSAANAGITFLKEDGSLDIDKMSSAGGQLQFQEKQLKDQITQAQLAAAQMPGKPTKDELISAEVTPFIKNANPVFNTTVDGMLSSVPALVAKYSNQGKEAQVTAVLQAVGTQQAQMNNWLDKQILNNNVSPDAAKQLREYYNAPFESMKAISSTGDFSSFKTTAAQVKKMNDTGQIDFRTAMPVVAGLKDAGGDNAVTAFFNLFLGTNTGLREAVNTEAANFLNRAHPTTVMQNGINAMNGQGYDLSKEQNPDAQAKTLKGLVGTLNGMTAAPSLLDPVHQKTYGNIINQVTGLGLTSNDPANLSTAAKLTNSASALATFDVFAKNPDNANQVPIVAAGMIALNTKALMRQAPVLAQGQSVYVSGKGLGPMSGLPSDVPNGAPTVQVKATMVYNPVTGKAEPQFSGVNVTNGNTPYKLSPEEIAQASRQMGGYFGQIADFNRNFEAVQHLAASGVGREKDFKPLELRQLLASGAGMALKPGTKPVPMPKFMQPKKPDNGGFSLSQDIADAQIDQESGGQNGLVSDQGAVGIAQIRPMDFPQYDAQRLQNDPEYALNARKEIMEGLLKKYKGNDALALAEYHGGPSMANWGPKTFSYVANIMNKARKGK